MVGLLCGWDFGGTIYGGSLQRFCEKRILYRDRLALRKRRLRHEEISHTTLMKNVRFRYTKFFI